MFQTSGLCRVLFSTLGVWLGGCGHSSNAKPEDGGRPVDDVICTDSGAGPIDTTSSTADVLTQRGDNSRTGVSSHEKVLTQSNVKSGTFGKVHKLAVDGPLYAQPLYVSSYPIGGKTRNLLIVATAHNSVFAFDADTYGQVWSAPANLGLAVPQGNLTNAFPSSQSSDGGVNPAELGVTGTPVIDRESGLIYVVSMDLAGGGPAHHLHVLDLATGKEMKGSPLLVNPSLAGTGDGTSTLLFQADHQLNRAGLLLLDGVVYVAFASQLDRQPYHGFILGYQYDQGAGTLTQKLAWASSLDGQAAGVWQGGQGLTVGADKHIYAMTGNGTTNVQSGGTSYAEAFVKLSPSLTVEDWFVPSNYAMLTTYDSDVGSGGPILIPGTHLVVGAGKAGILHVVDTCQMGHLADNDSQIVQEFPIEPSNTPPFFGSPLAWTGAGATRLYIWGVNDRLKEFVLSNGKFGTTPAASSMASTPNGLNPVGCLSLSSNGDTASSAVLWATKPEANPNNVTVQAVLYAFDPVTLNDLWDSSGAASDDLGTYAKFVPPTVANGKVFVATNSGAVMVYGLLSGG